MRRVHKLLGFSDFFYGSTGIPELLLDIFQSHSFYFVMNRPFQYFLKTQLQHSPGKTGSPYNVTDLYWFFKVFSNKDKSFFYFRILNGNNITRLTRFYILRHDYYFGFGCIPVAIH